MTEEQVALLRGAYSLLGQFFASLEVEECDHPEALAEQLPSNGKDDQHFRCGQCGEAYTKPWPEG